MGLKEWLGFKLLGVKASPSEVTGLQIGPYGADRTISQPEDPKKGLKGYREWVYSCANLNALGVARTPLRLYVSRPGRSTRMLWRTRGVPVERRRDLERREGLQRWVRKGIELEEVVEHPFLDLWENGNPFLGGAQLKRMIVLFMDLVGDTWGYIAREEGKPQHLLLLPPDQMSIGLTDEGMIGGYIQKKGTRTITYMPEEIVHWKHPDPRDEYQSYGYSPLEAVGLEAELYHKMNVFETALMDQGAVPDALMVVPAGMDPDTRARLERKWRMTHSGAENRGKFTVVSGKDVEIKQLGLSQKDMQFREGRHLTRNDIASAFNVPMGILTSDDVNKANAEVAELHHAKYGIAPRCTIIEDEINRTLMAAYDENIFVAFDNPVPADLEYQLKKTTEYVDRGIYTINHVLERDGEEPVAWGDTPILSGMVRPLIYTPPTPGGGEPVSSPEPKGSTYIPLRAAAPGVTSPDDPFKAMLIGYFERQKAALLRMTGVRVFSDPIEKRIEDVTAAEWDEILAKGAKPIITRHAERGGEAGAAEVERLSEVGVSFNVQNPRIQDWLDTYTLRFAHVVNAETEKQIRRLLASGIAEGLSDYEIAREIARDVFGEERVTRRAMMIARTEEARAVSAGTQEAYRISGVVEGKEWLAASDACEFCLMVAQQMNNVNLNDTFAVDGAYITGTRGGTMHLDYGDIEHPPLHPSCRCAIGPILVGERSHE